MKLLRHGPAGQEKPGMFDRDGKIRDLSGTLLDIDGKEQGYQSSRSLDELRRGISRQLETAAATRHSLVIRPRSPTSSSCAPTRTRPSAWRPRRRRR